MLCRDAATPAAAANATRWQVLLLHLLMYDAFKSYLCAAIYVMLASVMDCLCNFV